VGKLKASAYKGRQRKGQHHGARQLRPTMSTRCPFHFGDVSQQSRTDSRTVTSLHVKTFNKELKTLETLQNVTRINK